MQNQSKREITFDTQSETTPIWAFQRAGGDLHRLQRLKIGREDKRTNNRTILPALKNNAAADYQGPVKIELFKVKVYCPWTSSKNKYTRGRVDFNCRLIMGDRSSSL